MQNSLTDTEVLHNSAQTDEIEALSAIYGTDFHTENAETGTYSIDISEGSLYALLQVTMPPDYPSESPPLYMLSAPWLKGLKRQELCGYLEDIYLFAGLWHHHANEDVRVATPFINHDITLRECRESIIYLWVERVREFMVEEQQRPDEETEEEEISIALECMAVNGTVEGESDPCPEIFSGDIISDRKSHFQPHLAAVTSQAQVRQVLSKLYENRKIAAATHNMYAYRLLPPGTSSPIQDCEDDGEDHAGGRMLHLLQILDVTNVMVVVSRWYGGIHLGPDRFKHINNAARQILDICGYIKRMEDRGRSKKKK